MTSLGWLFIFTSLLLFREAAQGRSLSEAPGDIRDFIVGLFSGDMAAARDALSRQPAVVSPVATDAQQTVSVPVGGGDSGAALLAELRRLGVGARYVWGGDGSRPGEYDCSGFVWRGMKNLGIYTGPRFVVSNFESSLGSKVRRVSQPSVGDVVCWHARHMGVVDGPGTFYSALSSRSGIRSSSISAERGAPEYFRIVGSSSQVAA